MYLVTCTHVRLLPVRMDTIRDIWGLLFDRHQKVQRTPIESCHDMLTLQSLLIFLCDLFFVRKQNEQNTDYPIDRGMVDPNQTSQHKYTKKNLYIRRVINIQYKKQKS